MPELTREELWRQLKQDVIARVYVLYGPEAYLRDRAADQIVERSFAEGDLRDFNLDEFSLNDTSATASVLAAARQLPMMSRRRVVRLTNVRVASTPAKDTLKEEFEPALADYLSYPSPETVLIIVADELNGNRKLTRLLKSHSEMVSFGRLEHTDLIRWINRQFDDQQFTADDRAVRRLAELVGADLRRMTSEISKLCTASLPSKVVTFELVESLVPNVNEIENWALTDAIVSGNGRHALSVLKKILDDGAEPVGLLGLLSYNFRRLLMSKEMMTGGVERREISSLVRKPYRQQEDFLAAARRMDRTKLINAFQRIAEADVSMKTSVGGSDLGSRMQIEILVCELTAAMKR